MAVLENRNPENIGIFACFFSETDFFNTLLGEAGGSQCALSKHLNGGIVFKTLVRRILPRTAAIRFLVLQATLTILQPSCALGNTYSVPLPNRNFLRSWPTHFAHL